MQFMETLSTPLVSLPIQANPEAPTVKSDNQNRPVLSLIDQCTSLRHLKQVHAHMLRTGCSSMRTLLASSSRPVLWFVQGGCFDKALELFREMEAENVKPNAVTKKGIKMDLTLSNAMLDMYAKCGSVEDAKKLFDEMEEKDIVSWTTMIDGTATWNALISAYDQNGKPQEALAIFHQLQLSKNANPDELTFVSTLSSYAQLGAMDVGEWIHEKYKKQRMKLNCHLTTSLIDMYSKCGNLEKALNSLRFSRGRQDVFNQMEPVVVPGVKHYACMVDILGRAGLLEEAVEFIEKMPITPSASVWGALLGACKIHENVELAEQACSRLLELEPENDKALVLLSNIYAKTGKWDNVSELKKRMRVSELQKERGWSSMEVNGTLHKFLAADNSHPLSKEIYSKLDEIVAKLKSSGHVTNKSLLLQLVDEEDMKEQGLNLHGEKLAIAFGLISTSPSQLIRIVKNLRVCGDCHTVAKLISKLYNREILLRDSSLNGVSVGSSHISSLGARPIRFDDELDLLAFSEAPETIGSDGGLVDEDVLTAVIWGDETETLLVREPLDLSSNSVSAVTHVSLFEKSHNTNEKP
ncbi:hypothetical protein EZV62_002901 [Acer yangbiense]|uniref:DYW domain-containing protein n=1 Tax=Acer yangbiense TaxID=1000413 RepID=A0A5C7J0F9_9ROSI|nr:hypothetical protein EZV62_002901 [Acer yangbiense]